MKKNEFKSGFAGIIGMPNVGKSTLLNQLIGQKIAIISDKPQTTRNKILAIYTTDEEQIIFTDTPGIHKPHNRLGEYMVKVANESMQDMDVLLLMVDATRNIQETERQIAESIGKTGVPCILVMNKIDLVRKEKLLPLIADYSNLYDFDVIVPISAKTGDGAEILLDKIKYYLKPVQNSIMTIWSQTSRKNRLRRRSSGKSFCGCWIKRFRMGLRLRLKNAGEKKNYQHQCQYLL